MKRQRNTQRQRQVALRRIHRGEKGRHWQRRQRGPGKA
jgi:hypothetical protein